MPWNMFVFNVFSQLDTRVPRSATPLCFTASLMCGDGPAYPSLISLSSAFTPHPLMVTFIPLMCCLLGKSPNIIIQSQGY